MGAGNGRRNMRKGILFFCMSMIAVPMIMGTTFKITILYDNTVHAAGTRADWGFACLVETGKETLLFDTGTKPAILAANTRKLGLDLGAIRRIMISHRHNDHCGGIGAVLRCASAVTVYIPPDLASSVRQRIVASGGKVVPTVKSRSLGTGLLTTGIMSGRVPEQGLILQTGTQNILITGCAHPGISAMVHRARELTGKPIDVVLGGFHLHGHSSAEVMAIVSRFRQLGVGRAGPTHCTGEAAIAAFRKAYKEDFIEMGTGRVLTFE